MKKKNKTSTNLVESLLREDPFPMEWESALEVDGQECKHEAVRLVAPVDPWRRAHRVQEQDSLTEHRRKRQQEASLSRELDCWECDGEFVA